MSERVVHVEIHGQRYPVRSSLEQSYVAELAAYVDEKMRLAMRECPQGDSLKIAVLAALNIADEFFRARDDMRSGDDSLARRAGELERMLDLALGLGDSTPASTARVFPDGREEPRTAVHG
jgi:cell division protein ZapA